MKYFLNLILSVLVFSNVSSYLFAAETMPADALPLGMDAETMAAMTQRMSPGEAHKIFDVLVGNWSYTAKFWMTAESTPEETAGASTHTLVYGGRFLRQEVRGMWMGSPFEGTGILGYDNVKEEYVNIWYDNMMTSIMTITGSYNAATKTLSMSGENSCPMTGDKALKTRAEYTVIDRDNNTYTSYAVGPDGREFKAMEIVYTRIL